MRPAENAVRGAVRPPAGNAVKGLRALRAVTSVLLICLLGSCGDGDPAPTVSTAAAAPNVLLICLDTVRADHLGAYGYTLRPTSPNLDALAAAGIVFTDTSATAAWTKPSVPSFLTGSWPAVHGVYEGSARRGGVLTTDILGERSKTLAEAFAEAGYDTAAFLRNAQLRPGRGFEQGFDVYVDQAGDAAEICNAALGWLDERQGEQPFFLYLHILDAHWPYDIPAEAAARFAEPAIVELISGDDWRQRRDAINDGELLLDAGQQQQMLALYDGAIAYADAQLGLLFDDLRQRNLFDDMVVAMVADHGEEFLEHGRLGHGHGLFENLTRVGWIMDGPGIAPARIDTPVSLVDLYPTLLSAAGLTGAAGASLTNAGLTYAADSGSPSRLRGTDRLSHPERLTPIFSEHKAPGAYWQSLRVGRYKLVRQFVPPQRERDDSPAAGLLLGDRWEVKLRAGWAAELVADQVKPRDESADDPLEIKGVIEGVINGVVEGSSEDHETMQLQLSGLTVTLGESPRLSGTLSTIADLRVGAAVKVKAVPGDDGGLIVVSAKGYEAADIDTELRGPVTRVVDDGDGSGTFWLAGLPVRFDALTLWKHMPAAGKDPLLEREDVARLLTLGAAGAEAAGFTVTRELFDLQADPEEHAALIEFASGEQRQLDALDGRLDVLGRELIAERVWGDSEGVELGEEDVAALRALGYVK